MKLKPKISVIVPVFNVEDYLEECLESILNQTYGLENIELIIIDDASTDMSYKIAEGYQKKYPRTVRLIQNKENVGLGKVRNIGEELSTAEYIFFVDSDDLCPINALEVLTNELSKDTDVVLAKHVNRYGKKITSAPIYKQFKHFENNAKLSMSQMDLKSLYYLFDLTPAWGKLYRVQFLRENNIKAVEGHYYEDALFTMTSLFYSKKIQFIDKVVYIYRRDNFSSITRSFSFEKNKDYIKSIMDVRSKLLINDFHKYKRYSDLRLFNVWRTVIFINCCELIPDDEIESASKDIVEWMKLTNELSDNFVNRLPAFWVDILRKIRLMSSDKEYLELFYYFKRLKKVNPTKIFQDVFENNKDGFTFEGLFNIFQSIELSLDLINQKISGTNFWRLVRFALFERILVTLKMQAPMGSENTLGSSSIKAQIEKYHTTWNSCFAGDYQVDVLIFDHSRRQKQKDQYIDYKSYYILEELQKENMDYQVLELPFKGEHLIESSDKRKYLESLFLFLEKKIESSVSFTKEEHELLLEIEKEFFDKLGVVIEIRELIVNVIKDFKIRYLYFVKLFNKRKPKKIILIGAWWQTALIAAAQTLNIEVIDVQYAAFSKYHLGFCYPSKKVPYYPDKIMLWGEYWKKHPIPLEESEKIIIGNQHVDEKLKEFKDQKKNKGEILFISQGVHGSEINRVAFELAKSLKNYNVYYKLHPKENCNNYNMNILPNLIYLIDDDDDLFKYLASSSVVVGVYSTAVLEAAAFRGTKVILLNLFGVEHFKDLVDDNYFFIANSTKDVINIVMNDDETNKSFDYHYFFGK